MYLGRYFIIRNMYFTIKGKRACNIFYISWYIYKKDCCEPGHPSQLFLSLDKFDLYDIINFFTEAHRNWKLSDPHCQQKSGTNLTIFSGMGDTDGLHHPSREGQTYVHPLAHSYY